MSDKFPGGFLTAGAPAGFSVAFDGSGDYLNAGSNAAFSFGTGAYTVECWVYATSLSQQCYVANDTTNGSVFYFETGSSQGFTIAPRSGSVIVSGGYSSFVANKWMHVVYVRGSTSANQTSIFVNGTRVANGTDSTNWSITGPCVVGGLTGGTYMLTGYMSNVRVVKGTAVYDPTATTINVPTQLFPVSGTSLLVCQSPTIIDNSSNAFTITANGDAKVSNFTPFAGYTGFNPALGAAAGGVWTLDEAAYYQNNRQWPIYDPYFNQTTLMLHGNGTNGAQNNTFLDSSTNNFTITRNGNTTQGTFTPFSQTGWSNYFGGSDYFTVPNNAAFNLGSNNFTIECWVYQTASTSSGSFISQWQSANDPNSSWQLMQADGTTLTPTFTFNVSSPVSITSSTATVLNTWYHIAAVRNGSTVTLYLNGVSVGSSAISGSIRSVTNPVGIGTRGGSANSLNFGGGYISNARVVNGTAVYTSNFTPSTQPLTAVAGTALLTSQSQRFVDNSAYNFSLTVGGTPSVQAFSPFVPAYITPTTYSNYFDGTGDYLSVPDNAALEVGSSSFTVEAWVYATANQGNGSAVISKAATSAYTPFMLALSGAGNMQFYCSISGSGWDITTSDPTTFPLNRWVHVAGVRNGTTFTLYINGVAVGTPATSSSSLWNNTESLLVGWINYPSASWVGCISNVRLVIGTAVYTANFTPPTAPLTAITNTAFLSCQNSTLIDNSTNNFTLTANGNVQPVTSPTPFPAKVDTTTLNSAYSTSLIGGGAYFDGTTDYLSAPTSTAYSFGTGDFTIDGWIYPTTWSAFNLILDARSAMTGSPWNFGVRSGLLEFYNGTSYNTSNSAQLNTWNHVAVSRTSGVLKMFINGVQGYSASFTSNLDRTAGINVGIAQDGSTSGFIGYMSNIRIIKGTGLYTASFAPPTAPTTAVTNTQLLLNYTNGAIFDNTAKNVLETVGNAQISTTQSKYGGSSLYLDGTGDYLFANSSSNNIFSIGTGDFTVEVWVNFSNISNNPCICSGYVDASNGWYFQYYSNAIELAVGSTALISKAATVSNGTWYHMAVTRSGGTLRAFLNGVQQGTSVTGSTTNLNVTNGFYVGILNSSFAPTTRTFAGYMNDLRITKGVARYTTNFTPPTSQLQDQ